MCAPFSSQSFRDSYGRTSSTKRAPADSQCGRPAGNAPSSTQSAYGSVTTGAASSHPVAAATSAVSPPWSRGVIRSTEVETNDTDVSSQAARSGEQAAASSSRPRRRNRPLPGTLSHGTRAIRPPPVRRRASSASRSRQSGSGCE